MKTLLDDSYWLVDGLHRKRKGDKAGAKSNAGIYSGGAS
jgi:hypothetical protein